MLGWLIKHFVDLAQKCMHSVLLLKILKTFSMFYFDILMHC